MMKFSTLWSLDRTVDPISGRSPIADAIAANWEHDSGSVCFFRSSANFIYTLDRHGRRAYLRIAADTERSAQTIANELAIISCLRSAGLSVVQPIPAKSGDLVTSQDSGIGGMHAVLFDNLDGQQRELDELSIAAMETWGSTVGRLHVALKAVPSTLNQKVPSWQSSFEAATREDVSIPDVVREESGRLQAVLQRVPINPDTFGLLHNDVELDNLVWTDNGISILDFDEYGSGWYLLDIAKALTDPMQEGETVDSPRIAAFLAGYRRNHPLDEKLLSFLPDFLALSEFRGYMSLVRAIDLAAQDAEADWMRGMIGRLRGWMADYERQLQLAQ